MTARGLIRLNLTNAELKQAVFLTLALFLIFVSHFSHADTPQPIPSEENKRRISEVENYIRQQSLQGVSLLPGAARTALGWVSGGWHPLSLSDNDASPAAETSAAQPIDESSNNDTPFHFISNFHHKGFLPTHDAMMMGVGLGRNILDNKLQFTARPFYGQSWHSLQGYWGSEFAMNVAQRADGLPWGKIAISYVDGTESMTDHGRGIDLHGDVDLTHNFTFTTGMRQSRASGDTNYVMVKWKIGFE